MNRPFVFDDFVAEALKLPDSQKSHLVRQIVSSLTAAQIVDAVEAPYRAPITREEICTYHDLTTWEPPSFWRREALEKPNVFGRAVQVFLIGLFLAGCLAVVVERYYHVGPFHGGGK